MDRRRFLQLGAAVATQWASTVKAHAQQPPDSEFDEISVSALRQRMRTGALTSEQITNHYLRRIDELDRNGPVLRSVIEVNPEAIAIARALDAEFKTKGPRGPLHGVPVLLKDNIDTADRMKTTAGSLALLDAPSPKDSTVAAKLRAAGAVILGKTNLSEWANFRSSHSTSGWSGRGGQTKHPYVLDRNPCGSSSGSGVAISANLSALAVGTETDGSVICPSAMCGIVGIKPTLGLISRAGIIPIGHSQDTAGPMARTVRDAALLLGALAGHDDRDIATAAASRKFESGFTQFCDPAGLRNARIGIARQFFTLGPAVDAMMTECLDLMRKAGAVIIDPVELTSYGEWPATETEVLLYEFKAGLNSYLKARGGAIRCMEDVIAFNLRHKDEELRYFGQELMEQAQAKGPLTDKAYKDALATNRRLTRKEGIDAAITKHRLDAIAAPTAGPPWITDLVAGDRADSGCASPPAVAGYPHITVPAGSTFGLPLGISFFGGAWTEPKLIRIAYAFEQLKAARRPPKFLPTINLPA